MREASQPLQQINKHGTARHDTARLRILLLPRPQLPRARMELEVDKGQGSRLATGQSPHVRERCGICHWPLLTRPFFRKCQD